jgi:hypothetical protein
MMRMRWKLPLCWLLPIGLLLAAGCGSGKRQLAVDREPVTNYGVGATILMPGQALPMPPDPGSVTPGTPSTPQTNIQMLGGASVDVQRWESRDQNLGTKAVEETRQGRQGTWQSQGGAPTPRPGGPTGRIQPPLLLRIVAAPIMLMAWPFKKLADALDPDEPAPSAALPAPAAAPPAARPADAQAAWEAAQLEALEREVDRQQTGAAPPAFEAERADPPPPAPPPAPGRRLSIQEELAALQAPVPPRLRPEDRVARVTGAAEPPTPGLADRVRDRDGDGRPDLWAYHDAAGRPTRELLDENRDGTPDRTVWYDPATGREQRVEEDTNLDGRVDSWVEFRDGQVARQRRDSNHDGFLDSWSFYRDGALVRQEEDLDGDGFRNRVVLYEGGRLAREREDRDGDGRVERVTHYDASERVARRDEDTDGDGLVDVRSVYEDGRLLRRELVDADARESLEGDEELTSAAWSSGPEETPEAGTP